MGGRVRAVRARVSQKVAVSVVFVAAMFMSIMDMVPLLFNTAP
jgi:hypothetical protein